ncbi:hypothetical protein [Nocardioides soli]|uniref:Uncharacterized protein n=1 Tax=Nocardioides soli TaxID=1036020 RepID=A0A7W4VT02_9ACTN|nr:hypothetical protein [Nocardioides soli]MBB3041242.1 hypothetical protein [Nocardioides soli]
MITIADLAAELDSNDTGATANAICGFLGHLPALTPDTVLDADDEAIVRETFGA